jgi:hypothetical protein
VSLLHSEVIEEGYHLVAQIGHAAGKAMLAADVEGDGTQVA